MTEIKLISAAGSTLTHNMEANPCENNRYSAAVYDLLVISCNLVLLVPTLYAAEHVLTQP